MMSVREPPATGAVEFADGTTDARSRTAAGPLGRATVATLLSPPILPARPWRWRVHHDHAELWLAPPAPRPEQPGQPHRDRPRADAGNQGGAELRRLALDGGVAVHQALIALAGAGHLARVDRLPDPYHPELLARLTVTGHHHATVAAAHAYRTMLLGDGVPSRADPRPTAHHATTGLAVLLRQLEEAAAACGAGLLELPDELLPPEAHLLPVGAVTLTARAAGRAAATGLAVRPAPPRAAAARPRTAGPPWTTTGLAGATDPATRDLVLFAVDDTVGCWLEAGEALAAAVVTATAVGPATVSPRTFLDPPARHVLAPHLPPRAVPVAVLRVDGA